MFSQIIYHKLISVLALFAALVSQCCLLCFESICNKFIILLKFTVDVINSCVDHVLFIITSHFSMFDYKGDNILFKHLVHG